MSTIMKYMVLDGWVKYCDGSIAVTNTTAGIPNPHYTPKPTSSTAKPTTTSKPTSTTKPIVTTKPSTTTKTTTSVTTKSPTSTKTTTSKPTTTSASGGGSGCISKHWDQCGGQDYKGCTVCAVTLPPFSYFISLPNTVHDSDLRLIDVGWICLQSSIPTLLLSMSLRLWLVVSPGTWSWHGDNT